jgi:4-aminobutyrate aminotransferase/(S)-3-amino-2-methylpropionate transaminase
LSLTSKVAPYKAGFAPFLPDVLRVPYAYCYRCPCGTTHPDCALACVASIEDHFRRYADPRSIAAVVVEPVLGEGGFVVPPAGYLRELAALCRRFGILVIVDEVQTGFGRTGRMFACEHDGIEPDLLVVAKSLAAGLPLAAVIGRAEVMDGPIEGGLGGTYSGNPLACAAALAVLDRFAAENWLERSEAIGARIAARAHAWANEYRIIGDVRRRGAMVGIELVRDRATREPAQYEAEAIVRLACERGVLMIAAGTFGNVVRFLTPLSITDDELDEGLNVLAGCFTSAASYAAAGSSAPAF